MVGPTGPRTITNRCHWSNRKAGLLIGVTGRIEKQGSFNQYLTTCRNIIMIASLNPLVRYDLCGHE